MALTRPWAIDQAYPNAVDARKQLSGIYPREGIFPDPITANPAAAAAGVAGCAYPNGSWNVGANPFVSNLKRGGAPFSQAYGSVQMSNDASGTAWTIAAAPVSGTRVDLLWIRATDPGQGEAISGADGPGGVGRAVPIYGVTAGVAGAPGVAPALPAGAELIATVTTPSTATSIAQSTIVQSYDFAHVLGGPRYFRTAAALVAAITGNLDGELGYSIDTKILYKWNAVAVAWSLLIDDTGWINATLTAPTISVAGEPFQYRRLGGVVFFRGRVSGTSGAGAITTMPVGFRVAGTAGQANIFVADAGVYARVNIPTDTGVINVPAGYGASLSLSSITYIAAV